MVPRPEVSDLPRSLLCEVWQRQRLAPHPKEPLGFPSMVQQTVYCPRSRHSRRGEVGQGREEGGGITGRGRGGFIALLLNVAARL